MLSESEASSIFSAPDEARSFTSFRITIKVLLATNRMSLQKILQRNQSAVAIPKRHVSHTGDKRPLTTWN
jgi:hypothetical protein